jgi:FMN phosphatase YigB (HAD superfamily)
MSRASHTTSPANGFEGVAAEISSMCLYPEVPAVLDAIRKRGLKWAIVSNLAKPYAEPLLTLLPFALDACAWSFAVSHRKPEDGIYHYACKMLRLDPSSVLMVGDSLENDYNTPKRLGMQARHLKRSNTDRNASECVKDLTAILDCQRKFPDIG